jgi:hypothetical protein
MGEGIVTTIVSIMIAAIVVVSGVKMMYGSGGPSSFYSRNGECGVMVESRHISCELGDTRVPCCEPHEGVTSPLPRPLQQSDQACWAHGRVNQAKPQGYRGMHNLSSGVGVMIN